MNTHLQPWSVSTDTFPSDGFVSDRLEALLAYAVLAPSPHNTQPWLFRINVSDVEIYADRRRHLAAVDPFGRELHIACGAALLHLRIAAGYFGQACSWDLLPDPHNPLLLARFALHLKEDTNSEDVVLFHAIQERRTNREPFQPELVPDEVLDDLGESVAKEGAWLVAFADDTGRSAVADLVARADREQWSHLEFRKELAHWVRMDPEHQADGIPSQDFGLRDWMSFVGPALIRTFNRGNNQAARDADIALHSPVLAVLGTDSDQPLDWLKAGQALGRVLLHAQASGVSVSHLNQAIEIPSLRGELATLLGRPSAFPQILLRLGYGPVVQPTPRWDVRSKLIHQDHSRVPPH